MARRQGAGSEGSRAVLWPGEQVSQLVFPPHSCGTSGGAVCLSGSPSWTATLKSSCMWASLRPHLRPGRGGCGRGHKQTLEGRAQGWAAPGGWDQRVGQTHESSCPAWGSLSSHPYSSFTEPSLCTMTSFYILSH